MLFACDLEVGCHREYPMGQSYDARQSERVPCGQCLYDPAGSSGPAWQLGGLGHLPAGVVVGGAYWVGPAINPPSPWTEAG
jgi:hypothetical protein